MAFNSYCWIHVKSLGTYYVLKGTGETWYAQVWGHLKTLKNLTKKQSETQSRNHSLQMKSPPKSSSMHAEDCVLWI